jgi:ribosomal protein S18 acetylase RimI-like enzyme
MLLRFRPARPADFAYCERLYFTEMDGIIRALKLDPKRQAVNFRRQWDAAQARIIVRDGVDIGWLQSTKGEDSLFLLQLFVERPLQRQGIGTQVMNRLIDEAARCEQAVTLEVVKINPAKRLYERLGFRITGQDEHKFHMRRERDMQDLAK